MSFPRIIIGITFLLPFATALRAGPLTFTDLDAFLEAAGDVREIDFETLPDGSPSMDAVQITPEFNLKAGQQGSGGPRNWIIAELVTPATALAVLFPGGTTVSIFDTEGQLIASEPFPSLHQFGGFVSDVPIGSAIVDRGIEGQSIESFLFTPIPEPATLLLLGFGGVIVLRHQRR